jgi:hypothetical protein
MGVSFTAIAIGAATVLTLCSDFGIGSIRGADANLRTETMAFADCISLIDEISGEAGVTAANILRTSDVWLTRLDAADGAVVITCSRADSRLTLKRVKRPHPEADILKGAPLPASRG